MATRTEEAEGERYLDVVLEEWTRTVDSVCGKTDELVGFLILQGTAYGLAREENVGHVEEHGVVVSQALNELVAL